MWVLVTLKCVSGLFAVKWSPITSLIFQDGSPVAGADCLSAQVTEPGSACQDERLGHHVL